MSFGVFWCPMSDDIRCPHRHYSWCPCCDDIRCPYGMGLSVPTKKPSSVSALSIFGARVVMIIGARAVVTFGPCCGIIFSTPPQIKCHSFMSIVLSSETSLQCPSCYPGWREGWSRKTSSGYWGYSLSMAAFAQAALWTSPKERNRCTWTMRSLKQQRPQI